MRKLSNPIAVLVAIFLAFSGGVVPTLIATGIIAGPLAATPNNRSSAISSSADHNLGRASLIGTVNVASLPSPQENSRRESTPYTLSLQKSSNGLATTTSASPNRGGGGGGTTSIVSIINSFEGVGFAQSGGYVPPDVQVATGPNHVLEMANLVGKVFTKQGAPTETFSLTSFFNGPSFCQNLFCNVQLSDPKVLYDSASGRWFSSIIVAPNGFAAGGDIEIAVSTGNDPTGTWQLYLLVVNDFLPDQPLIGVSDDKFTVSANDYVGLYLGTGSGHEVFEGAQYWVLNKSELLAGASTIDYDSIGPDINLQSVYPAQSLSPTTTQYMVTVGASDTGFSSTSVKLISITGVPPSTVTVTLVLLPIATASIPPNAVQPGTNINVTTNDQRVLSAAWFQGNLWYSLTDSCIPSGDTQTRSCARITEISTTSSAIVQDMNYGANGQYYFFPAVTIDSKGGLDVIYGYSSSTIYPSLAVTGQAPGAPTGTFATAQVLKQGNANDTSFRYGDFFGAAVDPSDTTIAWVAGEYHTNSTGPCGYCWSTYIGSMTGIAGFAISPNPANVNVASGSTGTSTIAVKPLAGFAGSVTLSATVSTRGPTATLGPTGLTLPPTGSSTLTINVPKNITSYFTVTVSATSGSTTHVTTITVIPNGVADFFISSSASVVATPVYSINTATISLTGFNGFSGTISLSGTATPANPVLSFTPSTVNLLQGGTDTSLLTITVYSGTPAGLYSLSVTGTSGQNSHSISIPLLITPLGYTANNIATFTGVTVNSTANLLFDSPSAGNFLTLSGTISVVATNSTTGALLSSTSNLISKQQFFQYVGGGFKTILVVNTTAGPYPLGVGMTFNLTANSSTTPGTLITTITVTRNPDVFEYGRVTINEISYINYLVHKGCNQGTSCYDPRADLNADGLIDSKDFNIAAAYYGGPNYNQYGYDLTTSPSSVSIVQGSSGTSTLSVANSRSFAGTAALSSTTPSGLAATLNPASITLSGTSTLSVSVSSSTAPGQYSVVVYANSGFTTKSTTLTVNVVAPSSDYTISVTPSPVNVPQGSSSTATVTVTSVGGFSGTINLALTSSFSALTGSLSATTLTLSSGGSISSTLTVGSSTLGIFSVTITATSGSVTHTKNILVYISNFVFDNNFSNAAFKAGSPGAAVTFYAFSVDGALAVSLTAKPSKSGLTITFGANPINVPAAGYGQSTMGITSNTVGTYTVTVTATSGPLSRSIRINVQVCLTWTNCGTCQGQPASCPTIATSQTSTQYTVNTFYASPNITAESRRAPDLSGYNVRALDK